MIRFHIGRGLLWAFMLFMLIPNVIGLIISFSGFWQLSGINLLLIAVLCRFIFLGSISAKQLVCVYQLAILGITGLLLLKGLFIGPHWLARFFQIYIPIQLCFLFSFVGKGYVYDFVLYKKYQRKYQGKQIYN